LTATTSACLVLSAAGLDLGKVPPGTGAAEIERLTADPGEIAGLGKAAAAKIPALKSSGFAQREIDLAHRKGIRIIHPFMPEFPKLLKEISDPPLALYVEGDLGLLSRPAIGVVGSRNASAYGLSMASAIAAQLVFKGLGVVSGFARGVDAAAHRSAARAGGGTVGVLGCGIDVDYPKGHERLREEILRKGCMVSEFPFGTNPSKYSFPRRNRIISGLTLGVVVVEAAERSGALITARQAMEQGREVFAVPGSAFSHSSRGPHRLIRDGAKLTESVEDILEEIKNVFEPVSRSTPAAGPAVSTMEEAVMSVLKDEPVHVDDLSRTVGMAMSQLMAVLSLLEIKGCIRQAAGKYFSRA